MWVRFWGLQDQTCDRISPIYIVSTVSYSSKGVNMKYSHGKHTLNKKILTASVRVHVLDCWTAGQKSVGICTLLLDCWPDVSRHLYFTDGLLARSQ